MVGGGKERMNQGAVLKEYSIVAGTTWEVVVLAVVQSEEASLTALPWWTLQLAT